MGKIKFMAASKSDVGKIRTNNEDSFLVNEANGLFIVADGMGGHQAGEVASKMAVQLVQENFKKMVNSGIKPEQYDQKCSLRANQLSFCVQLANQAIHEASKRYPQDKGMGTTLTAATIYDGILSVAHVGDSRIYMLRKNKLEQLTQDHSLVMDQVRKGLISKDEAEKSKLANVLLRAIGTEPKVAVDTLDHKLTEDDLILFCSDGLTRMVTDDEIAAIIRSVGDNPQAIADTLIEAANGAGGKDNITVIIIKTHPDTGLLANLKSKITGLGKRGNNHA